MKVVFTPFERKSRSVVVFEALKEKIETGFWGAGERIYTENELAKAFNVGRSTVREALNLLKACNLVYTVPGMGSFVSSEPVSTSNPAHLDPKNIRDVIQVMEFRVAYEPYCASLAAKRITEAEIKKLTEYVSRQESNVLTEGNLSDFAEMDTAFHGLIANATRNTLFIHSFDLIREHLLKQQILSASYAQRRGRAFQYHNQIIQALKERDRKKAELVMHEHVWETKNAITAILKEEKKVLNKE
ncbi:MAG: FadR family transcriptional regulator [Synergistaceae bacterium]|nr:FadR family transcriptional regulator [Synergistaceae bacterium]